MANILAADFLDLELVDPNLDILAAGAIAGAKSMRSVDFVSVLEVVLVLILPKYVCQGNTDPVGLGRQIAALVDTLRELKRVPLFGGALASSELRHRSSRSSDQASLVLECCG